MHFAFRFFKYSIQFSLRWQIAIAFLDWNEYVPAVSKTKCAVMKFQFCQKLCCGDELAVRVEMCESVRFFRFFRSNEPKKNKFSEPFEWFPNRKRERNEFMWSLEQIQKKTMLNYDGRGRFMMRICGCMRACVCQYAARIFLYSFEKMATICQTSENISHISMYVRMFVCLLALICISYSKANDLFRSLSLSVCICLSVCYACLRKLCVCVSAFCFANWH